MISQLMSIYQESLLNQGEPECIFVPTEIFKEGWLLRAVLKEWKTCHYAGRLGFLPFPPDSRLYSESQLYTPFGARQRSDPLAEKHTHADGIVGHFSIPDTKSGIILDRGFSYFYPANNQSIRPDQYMKEAIADAIARRINAYDNVTDWRKAESSFARQWVSVLDRLCIWFVTWEEVIAEIANDDLKRFYELCLRFN